jgi:hypothetical protein
MCPFFYITVNATYVEEDGKTYQIIDGQKYLVDHGSGDDQSISDAFSNYTDTTKPDSEQMTKYRGSITSTVGVVLSVIIYLIFALTVFTTACDLLYIAIPPIRPYLYNPTGSSNNSVDSINGNMNNNQLR